MSLYAISDLHLSLADAVEKPMDIFGPEWVNHAERLSVAWRALVKPGDTVVVPGDISWGIDLEEAGPDLSFVDSLPGKKLLLRGNHDFWWASMKKMRGLYSTIDFIQNDAYEGDTFVICGTRGWYLPWNIPKKMESEDNEKILRREILRMEMSLKAASSVRNGRKLIVAMHFPPLDQWHTETAFTEMFKEYSVDKVVYGHLHGKHQAESFEGNTGGIEYRLVSLDKLDACPIRIV